MRSIKILIFEAKAPLCAVILLLCFLQDMLYQLIQRNSCERNRRVRYPVAARL